MDVVDSQRRHKAFALVLLLIAATVASQSVRAAEPKIRFDIPAGDLSQSMRLVIEQAGVAILYVSLDIPHAKEVHTRPVTGEFELREALRRMLEGTGFTFEFENARSVLIKRAISPPAATRAEPVESNPPVPSDRVAARNDEDKSMAMEEVIVTGSYLHGVRDIVSPLVILGEREKKQAAYGTVQDVLRTLPFNFGGGPSEDFSLSANFNRGSGVNLRGLGSGATLVLVNGRRQPVSGINGDFVDVSSIPWSAVERIEVLPDGGSALYGSDAVAGVINIILRQDLSGGETQARFGTAQGDAEETLFSQLFGNRWDGGKWLFAYQYSKRTALAAADRAYSANADKRPFGGTDQRTFFSNPGNILDPRTMRPVFAIPKGQNGESLIAGELLPGVVNLQNQREVGNLLPDKWAHNAFLTASQNVGERFELFAEGRYSHRNIASTEPAHMQPLVVPATSPFFVDPFGGAPFVIVAYNFLNEFGGVYDTGETETYTSALGVKADITDGWQATLSGFRGRESMRWTGYNQPDSGALNTALADSNPATAFNPFGSGSNTNPDTLDAIRLIQYEGAVSDVETINLIADGPLPNLPKDTPRLAIGLDYRRESFGKREGTHRVMRHSQFDRRVVAAFAELSIPLIPRLDFSLATRYEAYSDFGKTFNPKIGLRWAPTESLRFRSSWGSSFRAPTLVDLYDSSLDGAAVFILTDPHSTSGYSIVLLQGGSNATLHEETATTWTAGIDFASAAVLGLTLSSTYYVIDYEDRIWRFRPIVPLESLLADDQWASLVTRNPPQSQIDAICAKPGLFGLPSDCTAASVLLDLRVRNLSVTRIKGADVELQQLLRTPYGSLSFGLNGSYLFSFDQAITRAMPVVDLAGVALNPPTLRLRGTAEWNRHGRDQPGLSVSLSVDYLGSSRDYDNPPITRIDASMTFDLQLNYRTAKSDSWLGNVELTLNAVNVFDEAPPFVNRIEGYDLANADPFGRVISLSIGKNW